LTTPARVAATLSAASLVLLLQGCLDAPTAPAGRAEPPPPDDLRAAVSCTVDVRERAVACAPIESVEGALANRILGGQGVNLRLSSSAVSYDSSAQRFGMDVTVQNLLVQQMGTADGVDTAGIVVFFAAGPSTTSGSGAVSVRNADGEGAFTAFGQPYFRYPEILSLQAVSAPRRWEFDVPPSVQSFAFRVYVRTPLLPVVVFDRVVGGNRDVYRVALDGSDLVRLTTHAADDLSASVGGGTLVFTSYRDGNAELYSMPLTGGVVTRLSTTAGNETDVSLSRDGTRLAFVFDGVGGVGKAYISSVDGTARQRVTAASFGTSGSPEASPVWNPAGDLLAMVATAFGTADLFGAELPAGASLPVVPSMLAGGATAEVNPAFDGQGARLAYASNRTGDGDLYVLDLATGVHSRITSRAGAEANPGWLDDGRMVYLEYHSGGQGVLRWIDPNDLARNGTIPLPAGGRPDRPRAVPGP
jgi:hypothetical protein